MIDKGTCDKGFIWSSSNCECRCDKSCDIGEYLDYENCECRKNLVDKLVEECTEDIEEAKLAKITSAEDENKHKNNCSSCTLYMVLFSIIFTINIGTDTELVLFNTNTWIVMKKLLLNMILFIKQQFNELINSKYQTN